MIEFRTGCRHTIMLPASQAALNDACSMRRLKEGRTPEQLACACPGCPWMSTEPRWTDATGATPVAPVPVESTVINEPASGSLINEPASGSLLDAGFVPVPSGLPIEPLVRAEDVAHQTTPPNIDKSETAAVSDLFDGLFDEPAVVVPATPEAILASACSWWKAGGSLMGWSKLKDAKVCRRLFFYKHVLGLHRKPFVPEPEPEPAAGSGRVRHRRVPARELGTMVHACLESFYRHGDFEHAFDPCEAIKGQHPALALEARRLVNFYFDRFNEIERREWDMRCLEKESRYYFPSRKVSGKRRRCCVSAKLDGCYRQMRPGEARLPPGQRAEDGIRLHEVKTTDARIRGAYMKAQLLQNLLCFNLGHAIAERDGVVLGKSLAELVGDTWAVTITHIGKVQRQDPNKDIERTTFEIPRPRVEAYAESIGNWYYEEILDRLFSDQVTEAVTWPQDWLCEDLWFPSQVCDYVSLCEANEVDASLLFDQHEPLNLELLEMPAKLAKIQKEQKEGAVDNK